MSVGRGGEESRKKKTGRRLPKDSQLCQISGRTDGISSNTGDVKHQFKMLCRLLTSNKSQLQRTSGGHKGSSQIP